MGDALELLVIEDDEATASHIAQGLNSILMIASPSLSQLTRLAERRERRIELRREYQLLGILMRHVGRVVTRTMLLKAIWDYRFNPVTNVIDVHISRLRAKIDADHELLRKSRGQSRKSTE